MKGTPAGKWDTGGGRRIGMRGLRDAILLVSHMLRGQ